MQSQAVSAQTESRPKASVRLYYLDWLRVIAILGVFLFHAVHPFDLIDWHIKNAEQSMAVTVVLGPALPLGNALLLPDRGHRELVCAAAAHGRAVCRRADQAAAASLHHRLHPALADHALFPVAAHPLEWIVVRLLPRFRADPSRRLQSDVVRRGGISPLVSRLPVLLLGAGAADLPVAEGPGGAGGARPPGRVLFAPRRNPAVHRAARTGPPDPPALLPAGARLGRFLLPDGDLRVRLRAVRARRIRARHPAGLGHPARRARS